MASTNKCINYLNNNSENLPKIQQNLSSSTKKSCESEKKTLNGASKSSITLDERLAKDVNGVFPKRRFVFDFFTRNTSNTPPL